MVLIGLDAAEIDVVDRLVADGRMPNLARLRQQGRWGRLQTEPPHFLSLVSQLDHPQLGELLPHQGSAPVGGSAVDQQHVVHRGTQAGHGTKREREI